MLKAIDMITKKEAIKFAADALKDTATPNIDAVYLLIESESKKGNFMCRFIGEINRHEAFILETKGFRVYAGEPVLGCVQAKVKSHKITWLTE